jgi:hypothetical protein
MKKHKVVFYSPGTLFSESQSRDIDSWNIKEAIKLAETITYGKPYGFVFETYLTAEDVPDGEGGMLKVQPKRIDSSGIHFLGGTTLTYDMVCETHSENDILRSNMRANGYWIVCINTNSWKTTMPFNEKDCIVDASGAFVERGDEPRHVAYRIEQLAKRDVEYAAMEAKWEAERKARK